VEETEGNKEVRDEGPAFQNAATARAHSLPGPAYTISDTLRFTSVPFRARDQLETARTPKCSVPYSPPTEALLFVAKFMLSQPTVCMLLCF